MAAPKKKAPEYNNFFAVVKPKPVIIVAGLEGSRKTTFAMTFPGPIYVIGTEEGHERDTVFRLKGNKEVFATDLKRQREIKYGKAWCASYTGMWAQMVATANELNSDKVPSGTVIIDSASDLFPMAAAEFNVQFERGDKPIAPMMYGQVYPLIRDFLATVRARHTVVLTSRMKDVYVNEKATGAQTLGLWSKAENMAEEIIYLEVNKTTRACFAIGTKGVVDGAILINPSHDKIYGKDAKDFWFGNDDSKLYSLHIKLAQAFAACDKHGLEYEKKIPTEVEEFETYLDELRGLFAPPATETDANTNGAASAAQDD